MVGEESKRYRYSEWGEGTIYGMLGLGKGTGNEYGKGKGNGVTG